MLIDLVMPTRAWAALNGAAVVVSHLTERYGVFFIIVLRETSVAGRGVLGLRFVYAQFSVARRGGRIRRRHETGDRDAAHAGLGAGVRMHLAWRPHVAGRVCLAALAVTLTGPAAGSHVAFVAGAVLAQLLLEAFTTRTGAATVWEPPAPITLG